MLIKKRNEMIKLVNTTEIDNLSIRKSINFLLKKGDEHYKISKELSFRISKEELFEYCNITTWEQKEKMILVLRELRNKELKTLDTKYDIVYFSFLSQFTVSKNEIEVSFPPVIIDKILENNYYTVLNLNILNKYKSKYSLLIYELIERYKKETPKINLNEFRQILGFPTSYRNVDIKRRVLEQAKKELEDINDLELFWEIEKIGTRWNYIKLYANSKEKDFTSKPCKISDKLLKTIEKSRQNRFIDESYSQKAMEKILQKYEEKDIIKALGELYKYNSEIKSFSKILTAKIEDIKNSKMDKIKENQGYTLGQEEVETPLKIDIIEPKKVKLAERKEEISNLIRNSGLPTNKRLFLMGQLANIDNLEDLEKFKNNL